MTAASSSPGRPPPPASPGPPRSSSPPEPTPPPAPPPPPARSRPPATRSRGRSGQPPPHPPHRRRHQSRQPQLGRSWVGIDITKIAIEVILDRLHTQHTNIAFRLGGEPTTVDDAAALAELDKYEFQNWVSRSLSIPEFTKKGADKGIDGELVGVFDNGDAWRAIVSIKGGGVNVAHLRDLRGTVLREGADFGVLATLKPPTRPMREEAAAAGYTPDGVAALQILTVADLLDGRLPNLPAAATRPAEQRQRLRRVS